MSQTITILTESDVRRIVKQEIEAFFSNQKPTETITIKEAQNMLTEANFNERKRGYQTIKRLIREGVLQVSGKRIIKQSLINYINLQVS